MILKEQNNQKKTLTDGMLDGNHEQENTPSTNGKASPWLFLWGLRFCFAMWGCWETMVRSVSSEEHTGHSEGPCFSGGIPNRVP